MRPKPIILGLHSSVGKSGKDTLCEMLKGYRFAFGDALKEECARTLAGNCQRTYALILQAFHNQKLKDMDDHSLSIKQVPHGVYSSYLYAQCNPFLDPARPRSPRWHLQQYGTMRRNQNPDYWVNVVDERISDHLKEPESFRDEFVIVTDVRMPNELEMIKRLGGFTVTVQRTWPLDIDNLGKHISDTALDGYVLPVIKNVYGNPRAMVSQIKEVLSAEGFTV